MDDSINQTVARIRKEYGEIICLKELAYLFRYPSIDAARKSIQRKTFPVPVFKFPNRSVWYATAEDVAKCLDDVRRLG